MKLGVPLSKKNTAAKTQSPARASENRKSKVGAHNSANHTSSNQNQIKNKQSSNGRNSNIMAGQSYVWRVVVKNVLAEPSLNRTFTNKVEALKYLNKVIILGYKRSKLEKWAGK